MKKFTINTILLNKKTISMFILICSLASTSFAQVIKPFTQRASQYTPTTNIYNIKGDFTLIGNSNLSLNNLSNSSTNSNSNMVYIDADTDSNTINSSAATLTFSQENGANPECSNILFAGLYWTGRGNNNLTDLQKRSIKLKGPNDSSYQQYIAKPTEIMYPGTEGMYVGYIEVTDQIRNNGLGEYWVADLALTQGNGGSIGYYGGWSIIVVYENSKMNWRDVTIFDGYAFVEHSGSGSTNYELPVSGFNAVQSGDVNIKLGLMAGEGDRSIPGDNFRIRNANNTAWVTLSHSGNTTNNFFNSSIVTGGNPRTPNNTNNTGLDISMFNLDNTNNSLIANGQTQTKFSYGSSQDTYVIFNMAMSVDAYIPVSEGVLAANNINGNVPPSGSTLVVEPGDVIEYGIEIRNKGTEPIENAKLVVPVPFTSNYVNLSINQNVYHPDLVHTPPYFDPNEGATGAIVWNIQYLPLDIDINTLLADITFELRSTEDCSILVNESCEPRIVILGGHIAGEGVVSGNNYSLPLIQGYQENGICQGEPNVEPIAIDIDSAQFIADNCLDITDERRFYFCNSNSSTISLSEVSSQFPPASSFYNEYPVGPSTIQYTNSNPFPATPGIKTYYAVPPGDTTCIYLFTIQVVNITTEPTVNNYTYCVDEVAEPLSGITTNPLYTLYFYPDNNPSTVGQTSFTPPTNTTGEFTYYAAEGFDNNCVGNKVPIQVSVYNDIVITEESTNETCNENNDGTITLTVSGGSGDYSYAWTYNGILDPNINTPNVNNLPAGTYEVTVTDNNTACNANTSITINEPDALASSITSEDVLCNGQAEGSVNLSVTGGTAPYSYNWSNGETTEDLSNIPAGTYNVTITDDNGCTTTNSVNINEPDALASSLTSEDVLCNGQAEGSVNLSVTGGTPPYSYNWSNGATTEDLSNIPAGTYNVTVTDDNGCTTTNSVTINEPDALASSLTSEDVLCNGQAEGSVNLTVTGGTPPYSYNWSNGETTEDLSNIPAGTYNVTITDDNGCITTNSVTINEPDALASSLTSEDVLCNGQAEGSVNLSITGGNPPYSYNWSNGETTEDLSNIPAGTYNVTITDDNGCTTTNSVTINEPDALASSLTSEDVLCNGQAEGSVNLTVTGGTAPYSYNWSNGETTEDLNNIPAGTYNVTITDDNGCITTNSVTINEPDALASSLTSEDVLCNGQAEGSVNLSVTGGTAPYSYNWSNGVITEDLSNIPAGTYNVTITDDNGCTTTNSVTISEPDALASSLTSEDVLCNGQAEGSVSLSVTGGTPPYSYNWSNGAITEDLNNIPAGTYNVTITDDNGCTTTNSVTISEPTVLIASVQSQTTTLCGKEVATATILASGGTPPYTYLWDNETAETSDTATNLSNTTYNVIITDSKGCTFNLPVTILDACFTIEKAATSNASGCVSEGDQIVYTFTVNNTGEVSISDIVIMDDLLGGNITA
ncbi:SprB repeat-containing protein, partial [Oceanihabitans sediminis]|uniref:SprB repeat-containing protein n=1 Tax=Oceanihabitans sediminis TaxID=1812012 RepID=UPI00299E44E4